mmetsp:Transcript_10459/g.31548  ORF Transcript_10459/g.31548 Transcript_10459/m.31548 type:complete len:99 (+) Transcript_10459:172-468(+)
MKVSALFVAVFAALVASASAFAPAPRASMAQLQRPAQMPRTTMSMSVEAEAMNAVVSASNTLNVAANSGDFGGLTGPITCLLLIGAFITVLSPPLKGE